MIYSVDKGMAKLKSCPKCTRAASNKLKINLTDRDVLLSRPLGRTSQNFVEPASSRFSSSVKFASLLYASGKTKPAAFAAGLLSVGTTGFEPATPCTPCKCATGLRYVPNVLILLIQWGAKVIKKPAGTVGRP
jgi:hypothetical protein